MFIIFRSSTCRGESYFVIMAPHKMLLIALVAFLALVPQVYSCITLYEHADYRGASLLICRSVRKLGTVWNDRMSSYKVHSGRWNFYEHLDYKGRGWIANRSTPNVGWFNDKLTSILQI